MIENQTWSITAAGRRPGVDVASNEPSHIHVPRPSRVLRRGDPDQRALANTQAWSESQTGEEAIDRASALALVDLPAV